MQAGGFAMNRYTAGNAVTLLRSGAEYFPALTRAIAEAEREIWLETYIFADDPTGREIADALIAAARRGRPPGTACGATGASCASGNATDALRAGI